MGKNLLEKNQTDFKRKVGVPLSFYISRIDRNESDGNHVIQFIKSLDLLTKETVIDNIDLTFQNEAFDIDICTDLRITLPIPLMCFLSNRQLQIFFYWKVFSRTKNFDEFLECINRVYSDLEIFAFKCRTKIIANLWQQFSTSEEFSNIISAGSWKVMVTFKKILLSKVLLETAEKAISEEPIMMSFLRNLNDKQISDFFDLTLLPAENDIFNLKDHDFKSLSAELVSKNFG